MSTEEPKFEAKPGDRQRFAELKQSVVNLKPTDRIAQEVRLARELGITVTASNATQVVRPIERRMRIENEPLMHAIPTASLCPPADEGGQTGDLPARLGLAETLRAGNFLSATHASMARDMLKALRTGEDVEAVVTRLDPLLELIAVHGAHEDIIREAKSAYAQTLFAAADPMKSKKGIGGEPNS